MVCDPGITLTTTGCAENELQRRGGERHTVTLAHGRDLPDTAHNIGGGV